MDRFLEEIAIIEKILREQHMSVPKRAEVPETVIQSYPWIGTEEEDPYEKQDLKIEDEAKRAGFEIGQDFIYEYETGEKELGTVVGCFMHDPIVCLQEDDKVVTSTDPLLINFISSEYIAFANQNGYVPCKKDRIKKITDQERREFLAQKKKKPKQGEILVFDDQNFGWHSIIPPQVVEELLPIQNIKNAISKEVDLRKVIDEDSWTQIFAQASKDKNFKIFTHQPVTINAARDEPKSLSTTKKVAYRILATQLSKLTKTALLKTIESQAKNQAMGAIATLLDTEIGEALISTLLGLAISRLPEKHQLKILANEFQIGGMALAGNIVFDALIQEALPGLTTAFDKLPVIETIRIIPEKTQSVFDAEEEVMKEEEYATVQ